MKRKALWVIALTFILCTVFMSSALAVSKVVGGVSCTATKTITTTWGATWTSKIYSVCQSAIGTIGWTFWTDREYCNGTVVEYFYHGAHAAYGDASETGTSVNDFISSCSGGVQKIDTTGNHDFNQNGDIWRPLVTYTRTRP